MTAADLATTADIDRVLARQDALDAKLDRVLAALPPPYVSQQQAAETMGVDVQTVASMCLRGDLVYRMAGRRRLVLASSLRPVDRETVAALAASARGGR